MLISIKFETINCGIGECDILVAIPPVARIPHRTIYGWVAIVLRTLVIGISSTEKPALNKLKPLESSIEKYIKKSLDAGIQKQFVCPPTRPGVTPL